jgi:hypothetical protein
VEYEFEPGNRATGVRINYPSALATYSGRYASFQLYPAGESSLLSVPLGSLSGDVGITGQIKTRLGQTVAGVQDRIQTSTGTYEAKFNLQPGSYVCNLVLKEQATGKTYEDTIDFQVN